MAAVPKLTVQLSKKLLSSAIQKIPKRPCSALLAQFQLKNSSEGNKRNQVEQSDGISYVEQTPGPVARLVRSEEMINSRCLPMEKMAGMSTNWRSLMSPNLQQIRFHSNTATGTDKCAPKKAKKKDGPLPCVDSVGRAKKQCVMPKQPAWGGACPSICLPCCDKVEKPLSCNVTLIESNTCPRKTYRLASFSECNRLPGRSRHLKECCYQKRVCYASGSISAKEIAPLIPIKQRQAEKLGYHAKTPTDPWGS